MGGRGPDEVRDLFVYGTLRREARTPPAVARVLRGGARPLGPAEIPARLHDAGAFPAAVPDAGARVQGELWRLEDPGRVLRTLDRYEGHREDGRGLFRREVVRARRPRGERRRAWAYLYARDVIGLPEIESGDWLDAAGEPEEPAPG